VAPAGSEIAIPTLISGTIAHDPIFLLGLENGDQFYTRNALAEFIHPVLIEGATQVTILPEAFGC
jgi:hypothetical protein